MRDRKKSERQKEDEERVRDWTEGRGLRVPGVLIFSCLKNISSHAYVTRICYRSFSIVNKMIILINYQS